MTVASDDRKIIAPDYHGYGGSTRPPAMPHVTVQDYARTIWQALDSLDIGQVDLLGHHTGSKVAAEMAHMRPDSVATIIFMSASVLTSDEFEAHEGIFEPVPIDSEGKRIKSLWSDIKSVCGTEVSPYYLEKFLFQALQAGDAYQWGNRAAFQYNEFFPDVLRSLSHRTIVLNPNDDLYTVTPRIMKFLRNAELITKRDWGYGYLEFNTNDAAETIITALDGETISD